MPRACTPARASWASFGRVAALVRPVGGPQPRARRPARDADEVEHRACAALGDADFEDAYRAGVDRPDAVADDPDRVPARR